MSVVGLVYLLLNLLVARLARWLEVGTRIPH
jgi:ABC-type amino acid transport system permease subunit